MKKISFLLLLLCICTFTVKAQQNYEDVVFLNNGSIIHGIIIEQIPNKSLKIQTKDGNVFVFNFTEVQKMTKELVNNNNNNNNNNNINSNNKDNNDNKNNTNSTEITNTTPKGRYRSPAGAFWLSFLVPGGGQFYNGQYAKAGIMLGIEVLAYSSVLFLGTDTYSSGYSYYGYSSSYTEITPFYYIGLAVALGNGIWSMIDASVSARVMNRNNGYSLLNYKLDKNTDLALRPDFTIDRFGGQINPVLGAKLSLSLH